MKIFFLSFKISLIFIYLVAVCKSEKEFHRGNEKKGMDEWISKFEN